MIDERTKDIFDTIINWLFGVVLVFIIIGIAIGAFQLFLSLWGLMRMEGITGHYIHFISDVLTLYVLVELSRSLVEYLETHKLRLIFIADAAIVFIIREILIALFKHELKPDMVYAYSVLLLVIGVLRIGSCMVELKEK